MNIKKIVFCFSLLLAGTSSYAQNDSIAVAQMKDLGIYYFEGKTMKQILPLIPEKFKVFSSSIYLGENSENTVDDTPVFYVFIPSEYKNMILARQFRLVALTSGNGKRKVKARNDDNYMIMKSEKLSNESYKLYLDDPLKEGHYGIFYNYGSRKPIKLYDFDVVAK